MTEPVEAVELTDEERQQIKEAFDDNPNATGDWVITRKEWKQLFAAFESILRTRLAAHNDDKPPPLEIDVPLYDYVEKGPNPRHRRERHR